MRARLYENRTRLSVYFSRDELRAVRERSHVTGVPASQMVRRIVLSHIRYNYKEIRDAEQRP